MKKTNLPLLLMPVGLLLIGAALYLNQRHQQSDFVTGLLSGGGIGLLIVSIIKQRRSMKKRLVQ